MNLLFLKILAEKRKDEEPSQLIDLDTCDLHTAQHKLLSMEKKLQIGNSKN